MPAAYKNLSGYDHFSASHIFDSVATLDDSTRTIHFQLSPSSQSSVWGPMRVIALIDDPTVVRRILEHLGRWVPEPAERGPPAPAPKWPRNAVIPITYHPVPDIA